MRTSRPVVRAQRGQRADPDDAPGRQPGGDEGDEEADGEAPRRTRGPTARVSPMRAAVASRSRQGDEAVAEGRADQQAEDRGRDPQAEASTRIERSTWRRVAPTQRSSAKSRVRWAKRIEKVLAMTSTDTKSAIAAKTSSRIASTLTSLVSSVWRSSTKSSRGCTVAPVSCLEPVDQRPGGAAAGVRDAVDVEARGPALEVGPGQVELGAPPSRTGCRPGRPRSTSTARVPVPTRSRSPIVDPVALGGVDVGDASPGLVGNRPARGPASAAWRRGSGRRRPRARRRAGRRRGPAGSSSRGGAAWSPRSAARSTRRAASSPVDVGDDDVGAAVGAWSTPGEQAARVADARAGW